MAKNRTHKAWQVPMSEDYDSIDWKTCSHQVCDTDPIPMVMYHFCPWCGKDLRIGDPDLRKEKD